MPCMLITLNEIYVHRSEGLIYVEEYAIVAARLKQNMAVYFSKSKQWKL